MKKCKGTFTIEAAIIVPLILLVFVVLINCLFYYHDKNVIGGAAYETAAIGSGRDEMSASELETYLRERIKGRILLFSQVDIEIVVTEEQVKVVCTARKDSMSIALERSMSRTEPEDYIRNIRKIGKIGGLE